MEFRGLKQKIQRYRGDAKMSFIELIKANYENWLIYILICSCLISCVLALVALFSG